MHFGVTDGGVDTSDCGAYGCPNYAAMKTEPPAPKTPEMDESALVTLVKTSKDTVTLYTQIGNPEVLVKTATGSFRVIVGDMPRLRALSEQNDAHVVLHTAVAAAPVSPSMADWPLSTWVPILIMLAFLSFTGFRIWQQRKANGGGGGLFGSTAKGNMGKSKANRVDNVPDRFTDICGQENAKRDVMEVVEFLRDPSRFEENGAKTSQHGPPDRTSRQR